MMCRVLILDDNATYGNSLAALLISSNDGRDYHVNVSSEARDALQEAARATRSGKPYDVFLVDQRLGAGLNGIEVLRSLHNASPESESIIITGWEDSEDSLKAQKAGAYRYLPKSVISEELIPLLKMVMKDRKIAIERQQLKTFNEIAEKALRCKSFLETAQVLTREALRLGFERSRLFRYQHAEAPQMVGVCQGGKNTVPGFAEHLFPLAASPYLLQVLAARETLVFRGREKGPGGMEQEYGEKFLPPKGDWALLPLWVGERLVGALTLENLSRERVIRDDERRQLDFYARLAAGNLEQARLFTQEKEAAQRLSLLQKASVELLNVAGQDEEQFWLTLLTLATANYALGFNRAWVFLADASNTRLFGKLGIGQLVQDTARGDWEQDEAENLDFDKFLERLENGTIHHTELEDLTRGLVLETSESGEEFSHVLASGQMVILPEEKLEEQLPANFCKRFEPGACAVLPLRAGNATIGLFIVDNKHNHAPLEITTLDRLQTLINIAGLVWQNVEHRRQLEALLKAEHAVIGTMGQEPLRVTLQVICEAARSITNADWVIIYPLRAGGEYYYDIPNVTSSGQLDLPQLTEKPRQRGVSATIIRSGKLVVPDVVLADSIGGAENIARHQFIRRNGIRALIGVPVRSIDSDEVLGILYLNYHTPQKFLKNDIQQAELFANLASIAILNARHKERVNRELDDARLHGQASQRELGFLRTVLESALVSKSENGVIGTLLTNLQQALNQPKLSPALAMRRWQSRSLENEPRELIVRYTLTAKGELHDTHLSQREADAVKEVLDNKHHHVSETPHRLYVPVRFGKEVISVLSVALNEPGALERYHPLLERFASVAALALDNRRRQDHLQVMLNVAKAVTAPTDLELTFAAIVQSARQVSPELSALTLWYRDPLSENIRLGETFGVSDKDSLEVEVPGPDSIVAQVMKSSEPLWVSDLKDKPRLARRFVHREKIVSVAALPLHADNESVGAMFFNYRRTHEFTPEERTIFTIMAEIVAASIRDAARYEAERTQKQRLKASIAITEAVGSTQNLDILLRQVLSALKECFPGTTPCVLTYDEEDHSLEFIPAILDGFYPLDNPEYCTLRTLRVDGKSIASRVARRSLAKKRIVTENIPNVTQDDDYMKAVLDTRSELCASLMSDDGQLLGALVLEHPQEKRFSQEDVELAEAAAQQISQAMVRAQQQSDLSFKNTVAAAAAWSAELAHDIKSIIGEIRNNAYMIKEKSGKPGDVIQHAQNIDAIAADLATLGPWHDSAPTPIEIDRFLQNETVAFAKNRKEKINVLFELDCAGISILGDFLALQRVIRHLVRNAAEAMAESRVRNLFVRTKPLEPDKVEIQFRDSGPGVSEKVRPLILQQPISTKSGPGGYGLLLARQMVEDMKGDIRLLRTPPGSGCTFSIRLPRYTSETPVTSGEKETTA